MLYYFKLIKFFNCTINIGLYSIKIIVNSNNFIDESIEPIPRLDKAPFT